MTHIREARCVFNDYSPFETWKTLITLFFDPVSGVGSQRNVFTKTGDRRKAGLSFRTCQAVHFIAYVIDEINNPNIACRPSWSLSD